MKSLAIAEIVLLQTFRQRSNYFFMIVFPALIILLLGAVFGSGFRPALGVLDSGSGPLGESLIEAIDALDALDVTRYSDERGLISAVERGRVGAGLVVPRGYDETLRNGGSAVLRFFTQPGSLVQRSAVEAAAAEQNLVFRSARFAQSEMEASPDKALAAAEQAARAVPGVGVRVTTTGQAQPFGDTGRFDRGASTQLLLFVFITSLTGSAALIESRRLGVARRMLSTPTPAVTIVAGQAMGHLGIAISQGLIIMLGSALIFGVEWGNPLGAALVLIVFSLVGTGAAMLLGSLFRSEQQAIPVAILVSLGLAALGGSMVPLEVFPDTMRTIANATPHAWGNRAFEELIGRNGGVGSILRELGVLGAFAAALLSLAAWRLHRTLTS